MIDPFVDFTDIATIRSSLRPKQEVIQETKATQPQEQDSPFIKALEAKLLLTMKSREGKVNLLNAYLTRLRGVTQC